MRSFDEIFLVRTGVEVSNNSISGGNGLADCSEGELGSVGRIQLAKDGALGPAVVVERRRESTVLRTISFS